MRNLKETLVGTLVLGAVSALGDWLWANFLTDGAVLPGVIHGAAIFLILAAILAWSVGTRLAWRRLLPSLPIAGIAIAGGFYPIACAVGYIGALLIAWVAMWLALALLHRWAREGEGSFQEAALRAGAAAIGSGLAFWVISGIWTNPSPEPDYFWHFICWSFAFLPGFAALLLQKR